MPQVNLKNIKKTFTGKIVALKDITFDVQDQEYVTVLGPSGCGKTTLLRIIAGLETSDYGQIIIDNQPVNGLPPEERNIGFVFQNFALFPHLDVWQNITYGPRIRGFDKAKIEEVGNQLLKMIKLSARRKAYSSQLSSGMQQRVGLARALASGSKLILLDEPLSSLDAQIKNEIKVELKKLAKRLHFTAIHVTHDQDEAMFLSDRIVLLRKGEVEQIGTPRELYQFPGTIFVANFIGQSNFLEAKIADRSKKGSSLVLSHNQRFETRDNQFKSGSRVVIAFRPEEINLFKEEPNQGGLSGLIDSVSFLGGQVFFEVKLKGGEIVRVKVALSSHRASLEKGEHVGLKISPDRVLVYSYPEGGVEAAIKSD
ncbi:MAG TPA: ABC transporter ATP-binding protein [Candidatus Bathyarchaeia archaeon]|nr:ABC transporter ATP-binding protein [Candidatus Bathyarchaeia archaeon]